MQIENVNIEALIPYARNPRKNTEAVNAVAASIKEFGFLVPIVIDADKTIIAGHTRLLAAQKLELKQVPCVKVQNLSPQQIKAFRIIDNKVSEKAEWDYELLQLELAELPELDLSKFDVEFPEVEALLEANTDDDEIPAEPEGDPQTQTGDIWLCDKHRVMCGDATQLLEAQRTCVCPIDLYLCDPPYGISYADKNAFLNTIAPANRIQERIEQDHESPEHMKEFWIKLFSTAYQLSKPDASYYLFGGQGADLMIMMMMSIKDAGWQLKHCLIWAKNNHVLGRCDYNYKHEPILFGWKDKHHFYGNSSCVSLLDHNKPHKSDLHPTMKPISLICELIQNSTKQSDIVFDSCLGSGTTLIAADRLKRICYGMEISPHYCDVICQRFYNETGIAPVEEKTDKQFIPIVA